jgi:hypothetical protein
MALKWPKYFNVTLLKSLDNVKIIKKKWKTFHPFLLSYNLTDFVSKNEMNYPVTLKHLENTINLLVLSDYNEFKDALGRSKFHGGFTSYILEEKINLKQFNIPILWWFIVPVDPFISIF